MGEGMDDVGGKGEALRSASLLNNGVFRGAKSGAWRWRRILVAVICLGPLGVCLVCWLLSVVVQPLGYVGWSSSVAETGTVEKRRELGGYWNRQGMGAIVAWNREERYSNMQGWGGRFQLNAGETAGFKGGKPMWRWSSGQTTMNGAVGDFQQVSLQGVGWWVNWSYTPSGAGYWRKRARVQVPWWGAVLVTGAMAGLWVRWWRWQPWEGEGVCKGCGYDLRGSVSGVCSECGREVGVGLK